MYLTKEILQHTYFSFFEKKTRMHRFLRKAPAATDYFITFPIPFIAQGEGERAGLGHGVRAPGHKGSTGRWAAMTGWIDPAGTQNPCLVSRCHARSKGERKKGGRGKRRASERVGGKWKQACNTHCSRFEPRALGTPVAHYYSTY